MSSVPMTLPGLMLAQHEQQFMHSTTWVELDDGRILHASHHVYEHSADGGLTWSENQLMKDINGDQVGASETSLVKLSGHNEVGLCARVSETPPRSSPELMLSTIRLAAIKAMPMPSSHGHGKSRNILAVSLLLRRTLRATIR